MGCQAASDGSDSNTIKKDKQESFELSPNINRYKKNLQGLYNWAVSFGYYVLRLLSENSV